MEREKIEEPKYYDSSTCPRCNQEYCDDCITFKEVDFDIVEIKQHPNPRVNGREMIWSAVSVCPWCYNQLVDLKNKGEN